ncbi:MAG TPA: hypothetical protein VJU15_05515 [Gemmatimonadales bacterium]|nr:hypothetical protein [Gemmatimonadales bacterium]
MDTNDRAEKLLEEIRDATREQVALYRKVTEQSLELQRKAVERQERFARVYRRVLLIGGIMVVALLALLTALLMRWGSRLF